jgi:hypothetical protein
MILRKQKPEDLKLINAINDCLNELDTFGPDDPRYIKTLASLQKLMELQNAKRRKYNIDMNTVLLVAGNLAGIMIIVYSERASAFTSKAQGFILKSR